MVVEEIKKRGRKVTGQTTKVYKIHVQVFVVEDGDYYVAYCPALQLSSYDTTPEGAKKSFDKAMKIFIEETERKGTLEKVLLGLGWTLKQKPSYRYQPPKTAKTLSRVRPVRKMTEAIPIQVAFRKEYSIRRSQRSDSGLF